MSKLDITPITYKGKEYPSATIDNVLGGGEEKITIAASSLNEALMPDGAYADETARGIDETIYSFIDDNYFNLSEEEFIEKVKEYLD